MDDMYPFDLEEGPQRKEPDEPETWERVLNELCPA